jgi:hypothetical protein
MDDSLRMPGLVVAVADLALPADMAGSRDYAHCLSLE